MVTNNEEINENEIMLAIVEQGSYAKLHCKNGKEITIIVKPIQKETAVDRQEGQEV